MVKSANDGTLQRLTNDQASSHHQRSNADQKSLVASLRRCAPNERTSISSVATVYLFYIRSLAEPRQSSRDATTGAISSLVDDRTLGASPGAHLPPGKDTKRHNHSMSGPLPKPKLRGGLIASAFGAVIIVGALTGAQLKTDVQKTEVHTNPANIEIMSLTYF